MQRSVIKATGSYLPEKILSNADLEKMVDTSDEWIVARTGIKQRHIAHEGELTSHMATHAAKKAMQNAGISADQVDLIIVATTTPDRTFPSTAVSVQAALEVKQGAAFDVQAVCSGFVYALSVADSFIKTGQVKTAIVIGAEKMSSILDWSDRNTCILFGDGAGAIILQASNDDSRGIISTHLHSDGSYQDILLTSGGTSSTGKAGTISMQGKEVFKHAVEKMSGCVQEALKANGLQREDLNFLVPHQANTRIMDMVAKKLRLPKEKTVCTVDSHANTSAASIPLALDHFNNQSGFQPGDLIALTALGGGITWGAALLKW